MNAHMGPSWNPELKQFWNSSENYNSLTFKMRVMD